MSELAQRIYNHLQSNTQYTFSSDISVKKSEIEAISELENTGYIVVKTRTIGYVIASTL